MTKLTINSVDGKDSKSHTYTRYFNFYKDGTMIGPYATSRDAIDSSSIATFRTAVPITYTISEED